MVGALALSLALSREWAGVKSRACEQSNVWGVAFCVGKFEEAKAILGDKVAVSTSSASSAGEDPDSSAGSLAASCRRSLDAGPCPPSSGTALLSGAASGAAWVWSSYGTHPIASPTKTQPEEEGAGEREREREREEERERERGDREREKGRESVCV